MQLLDDDRLYFDTAYCLSHFSASRRTRGADEVPMEIAHFYWAGEVGPRHVVCLKSFLATQSRHRPVLWLEPGSKLPPEFHAIENRIEVRPFSMRHVAEGTPLARIADATEEPVARSDFARLLLLWSYGGLYSDTDILFLRDLAELGDAILGSEFAYRWSAKPYCNNALMRFGARSATLGALLERASKSGSGHFGVIARFEDGLDGLSVLPASLFDPAWLYLDRHEPPQSSLKGFGDLFRPFSWWRRIDPELCSLSTFFAGAFAFHWHGHGAGPVESNSYFGRLAQEIDGRLSAA